MATAEAVLPCSLEEMRDTPHVKSLVVEPGLDACAFPCASLFSYFPFSFPGLELHVKFSYEADHFRWRRYKSGEVCILIW